MTLIGDLRDCVDGCSSPIKVIRSSPGAVDCGRVQDSIEEEICALGSVTPATGKQIQLLPEGQRLEETIQIITTFCLRSVSTSEHRVADRVVFNGVTYQVAIVKDWSHMGGFYEVIATRLIR